MPFSGKRLREIREGAGESRDDLGTALGLTGGTIANYELERSRPGDRELDGIADHYGVTVDYLLGRSSTPAQTSPAPPRRSPALAAAFAAMLKSCGLQTTQQIILQTSGALTREEIERLRAGEHPETIPEARMVAFLHTMDVRDIRAYYKAAHMDLPQVYQDLAEDLREIGRKMDGHGVIDAEAIEWAMRKLREGIGDK